MNLNLSPAITPATIVSTHKTLSIPIYQRLFVWGEAQIDTLLNDLWNASSKNKDKDYYLGVITVHENDSQQWEIVDGQQRLTFLTLLGCLLKKKNSEGQAKWKDFVFSGDGRKELRLFFHGRPEDRKDIFDYANDSSSDFTNSAFARFAERFSVFANGKGEEGCSSFSEYCFQHAAFLVNELPMTYGPDELNLYFEKMNSTGRQLTPLEVVKGKWFSSYAARWNACMNFDKRFVKGESETCGEGRSERSLTLHELLDRNESSTVATGSTAAIDPPESSKCRLVMRDEILALHVLRLYTKNEVILFNRDTLIDTFNKVFSAQNANAKAFIEELEKYRKWIDENIIYLEEDGGQYEYKFRSEANTKNDEDEEKTDLKCMKQFQAMMYAASGDSQKWVVEAYSELKGDKLTFDFLRHLDAKSHVLDSSSLSYLKKIDRYWFWKLDFLLWEKCCFINERTAEDKDYSVSIGTGNEQLTFHFNKKEINALRTYKFRRNISIEHLHPQSKENDGWGRRDDPQAPMHQFGNLAMISVDANSAQSDDGIGTKFGRVQDWINNGRLESIKMLLMFKLCGDDKSKWNVDIAELHGKAMIKLLQEDNARWISQQQKS